jgi:RNA polymerase sigma-70 factor, ECF subfamily
MDETISSRDCVLIERISQGDSEALAELYDRYSRRLLGLAMRILGNRVDAEDVVQDVFMALRESAASYDREGAPVLGWLLVLTRNRAIDRRRTVQRRHAILTTRVAHEVPRSDVGSEAPMLVARLEREIERMSEAQARTLRLAYVEGLSFAEIARREGIPLGTVKSRSARALYGLRVGLGTL